MKKRIKKTLSMILTLAMVVTMTGGYHGKEVKAAITQRVSYKGSNVGKQNYRKWTSTMKSYLVSQDDGSFMRVQYVDQMEGLLVEYYDSNYNFIDTKIIKQELPLFGGFYATDSNYYIVTGQENENESDDVEVYRITKYDKEWNRIGAVSLKGANTHMPFDAGSCRMDMAGKYLFIRTCRTMYKDENKANHQSNITIQLDTEKMKITDSFTSSGTTIWGYVSHSFNQFIKTENGHIIALDHGDTYPRAFVVLKYPTDFTQGSFVPSYFDPCTEIPIMEFKGSLADNVTGASVGGFEISDDHYLVAANSVKQDDKFRSYQTRNVFVAAVDKSTSEVKTNYLTNYEEGEETTTTPQMVKISETRFMVLWTRGDQVFYTLVDNNGEKIEDIHSMEGNLSDCQPVISKDKVVWYTWDNDDVEFYDIDIKDLSKARKIIVKKSAPQINDIEKSYCYAIGVNNAKINLQEYLPSDIKNPTYEATITNPSSSELITKASKTDTAYTYNVSKEGEIGDQAQIKFTVQSDNYEDITFNVNITLTDKLKVTPKEGSEPAIEGSNELTYGQKISDLKLNTSEAKFIAEDGTQVKGTLKFDEPDKIPNAGTKKATYTFTPEEEQYKSYTGTVTISVKKATPELTQATVDDTIFAVGKCLKDLTIHPGKATVTYNGEEKEIKGSWAFSNPSAKVRIGKYTKTIVFTPEDTTNYETVQQDVSVLANIELQTSTTEATYGDTINLKINPDTLDPENPYTYRFYYVDENQYEKTIQKYSSETECTWKPEAAGTYTVYAQVNGKNCKTFVENIKVNKAKANKIDDITKEYVYVTGSGYEQLDLSKLLPEDITITDAKAEVEGEKQIIDQSEFTDKQKVYRYHVNQKGKIGDTATIHFTIQSKNYEDITFTMNIKLKDQMEIEPKEQLTSDIFNRDYLTYGETDVEIGMKTTNISLETKDGEKIKGILKFKNPEAMQDVGSQKIEYVFVPNNNQYKNYEGAIAINVKKCKPMIEDLSVDEIKYDPQKTMQDIPITQSAVVWHNRKMISITGTSKIKNDDQKLPLGKFSVEVEFIPDDTEHYETVTKEINLESFIELQTDLQGNEAKVGDKIHVSADPKSANLEYRFYVTDEDGNSETIRDYASDAECEWTTDKEGTFTIYAEAKDEDGNTAIASSEEITINKKEEIKNPSSNDQASNNASTTEKPNNTTDPTSNATNINSNITVNQTAITNGITYKITKVVNEKNAEVAITNLDKKKTAITIPDYITINGVKCKVVSITKKALYKGSKLKKITIGKNVTTIEDNAFYGCKNLKTITIKSTVLKKVGKNAIKGIHKKATIKVPKKQYKQYKKLFSKKTGFKKPMKLKK